jgi:DNA-binding response OmpR family regulator
MVRGVSAVVRVVVVADNHETLDGLHKYLTEAGAASTVSRGLRGVALGPDVAALVVFPDGFDEDEVADCVRSLRKARPRLLIVLVTAAPQRFASIVAPDGRSLPPIVLPKPAFGWTILDAIRAHLNRKEAL